MPPTFQILQGDKCELAHSLNLFWVMHAFGNLMKAAADSVQKLWSDSHLYMRIPRVAPQGRTRRPTLYLIILNKILIAWPMLIVTMPSKVNSKHPKSTGQGEW